MFTLSSSEIRMSLFLHQVCRNVSLHQCLSNGSEWVPSEWESDKNITIIHSTPVHQLTSGEDKSWNKSIIKSFLTSNLKYKSIIHNKHIHKNILPKSNSWLTGVVWLHFCKSDEETNSCLEDEYIYRKCYFLWTVPLRGDTADKTLFLHAPVKFEAF